MDRRIAPSSESLEFGSSASAPTPASDLSGRSRLPAVENVRHTRYGYWLEEAGPIEPTEPLAEDTTTDVVVVGAGYLGLWTAWQLKALEPGIDVAVLDAGLSGHGPSGRNGGFVSTLWDDLPILRDRVGDTQAVEACRASERSIDGIEAWCESEEVDAWFVRAPTLYVATSDAQVGEWDEIVEQCAEVGAPEEARPLGEDEIRARCASPLFRGGGLLLRTAANVHPPGSLSGCERRCSRVAFASTSERASSGSAATEQ